MRRCGVVSGAASGRGSRPPTARGGPARRGCVNAELRACVIEHLEDPGGVLVIHWAGDLKKARTRSGSNGSTPVRPADRELPGCGLSDLCGPLQGHASLDRDHASLDNALYLPKPWTSDPAWCEMAGVPPISG